MLHMMMSRIERYEALTRYSFPLMLLYKSDGLLREAMEVTRKKMVFG